jgi:hypothetical protein
LNIRQNGDPFFKLIFSKFGLLDFARFEDKEKRKMFYGYIVFYYSYYSKKHRGDVMIQPVVFEGMEGKIKDYSNELGDYRVVKYGEKFCDETRFDPDLTISSLTFNDESDFVEKFIGIRNIIRDTTKVSTVKPKHPSEYIRREKKLGDYYAYTNEPRFSTGFANIVCALRRL